MRVCVMGAGIVGLATAYELSQSGHEVTVIDRAQPGSGASGGNGSQLSYSYVQPLADPGIWAQLPKLLLSPSSPLKIRPQLDVHQWRWGLQFLAACNSSASRSTTIELLKLAAQSRQGFDAMLTKEKLKVDFSSTGKLVLFSTDTSFAAAQKQMLLQRQLGSVQEPVSARRCVEIEPALASYKPNITGAIYTPSECAADCQKTCDGLQALLAQRGVRFLLNTPVEHIKVSSGKVVAITTAEGDIEADHYVMALGSASAPMARQLGVYLPIYPLKGYSITVDVDETPGSAPTVSVTDSARKVVFARIGSRLRVAGMAELAGYDTQVAPRQIESLKASTQALFPNCSPFAELNPWAGLRPATPTALPLIGRHPKGPENMLFNVGHGALGFTLAFGSAARVAKRIV
ncbi:MAG: D-amino acid dehydrogenase [Vitreoscilla sp.]|nr:D-amino acid dehydrogenase [Polaromonas sp.]